MILALLLFNAIAVSNIMVWIYYSNFVGIKNFEKYYDFFELFTLGIVLIGEIVFLS